MCCRHCQKVTGTRSLMWTGPILSSVIVALFRLSCVLFSLPYETQRLVGCAFPSLNSTTTLKCFFLFLDHRSAQTNLKIKGLQ